MASKQPTAARINARAQKDKDFLKRALLNPGLRSKLSEANLRGAPGGAKLVKARALNTRLNAPVTPGSSMTERELARAANAASTVRYGPSETDLAEQRTLAQTQERNTGTYYDNYLAQLGQYQKNISDIQTGAQQGLQGIAQGITGLGQAGLAQVQNPAVADAQSRGAQAGDMTGLANQALAVRQGLVGGFQAQQQLTGATAQNYASGLANVVGPAQKLTALAQAAGKVADVAKKGTALAAQKGAYNQQYRSETRADEAKTVSAKEIATGKSAVDQAQLRETVRSHKAGEKLTGQKITATATQKQADRDAKAAADAAKAHAPNSYGVPADQWATWSTSHRQRVINAKAASKVPALSKQEADDFYAKYHVKPQGTAAIARGQDTVRSVQNLINKFGLPKNAGTRSKLYQTLVAGQTADKKKKTPGIAKQNSLWTNVALDIWQYGGITGSTAHQLHLAGYPVKSLGFKNAPTKGSSTYANPPGVATYGSRQDTAR